MTAKIETRIFSGVQVRAAAGEAFVLEGIAASYNMPSKPLPGGPNGTFTEFVAPSAFKRALRNKADVKCLFNHDANVVLGRTKSGTLTLTDSPAGLAFRCQLDQRQSAHQSMYASVKRGDVDECSFAFAVPKGGDKWSADYSTRTLTDVDLFDVSVVTDPAYGGGATSVDARQLRAAQYVVTDAWRSKHMAALAKLERQLASEKFDTILEQTKQAIDEARRKL
jgi:HK97 family phage prohead protease